MKNFRARELEGLMSHLRLHGPLPTEGTPDSPSIVLPNPFIPRKNPRTGKWRDPKYSLRRQADLVKRAKELGQLAIIPPGPKRFAMELRFRRLKASLSPTDAAIVRKTVGSTVPNAKAETPFDSANTQKHESIPGEANSTNKPEKDFNRISLLEAELRKRQDEFRSLEEDLESRQTQHELDDLAAFEKNETEAERKGRRQRQKDYLFLEGEIIRARQEIVKAAQNLENAQKHQVALEAEKARKRLWSNPFWVGEVKRKATRGEELGIKLYAGKKKMFKGHLWEKRKAKKLRRQRILMRDMKTRVERYKSVSLVYSFSASEKLLTQNFLHPAVLQEEETQSSQAISFIETAQATLLVNLILLRFVNEFCIAFNRIPNPAKIVLTRDPQQGCSILVEVTNRAAGAHFPLGCVDHRLNLFARKLT